MSKLIDKRLGNSVCLRMNGKTREGVLLSELKKGRWVIFYNEIPVMSLGKGLFLVYPNASKEFINKLECEDSYSPYQFTSDPYVNDKHIRDNKWYEKCIRTPRIMRSNW